jgi:hypothetical protein
MSDALPLPPRPNLEQYKKLDPQWYEDDVDRQRAAKKTQSDPGMLAALRGQLPPP